MKFFLLLSLTVTLFCAVVRADEPSGQDVFLNTCSQIRKKLLKAPLTAVFSSSTNDESGWHRQTNGNVACWGYVDSQNSFGAMIRTKWYASVAIIPRIVGDGTERRIEYFLQPIFLRLGDREWGNLAQFNKQ